MLPRKLKHRYTCTVESVPMGAIERTRNILIDVPIYETGRIYILFKNIEQHVKLFWRTILKCILNINTKHCVYSYIVKTIKNTREIC